MHYKSSPRVLMFSETMLPFNLYQKKKMCILSSMPLNPPNLQSTYKKQKGTHSLYLEEILVAVPSYFVLYITLALSRKVSIRLGYSKMIFRLFKNYVSQSLLKLEYKF